MQAEQFPHLLAELGWEHSVVDGLSEVRVEVVEEMTVPGTGLLRIGLLAIVVDLATGQPATGSVTPTIDLSVHVVRHRPLGSVRAVSRVLKAGATLFVADCLLYGDDDPEPFGTGLATFMNRPVPGPRTPQRRAGPLGRPLAERIGATQLAPGVVELTPADELANPHHGTVQGGVTALLGELAAASLFGDAEPHVVTDLDIRYLGRVKAGPVRATARRVTGGRGGEAVTVEVVDVGAGRLVAHLSTSCLRAARLGE
jgi:uncharacterized protein (TIGR00369 family)